MKNLILLILILFQYSILTAQWVSMNLPTGQNYFITDIKFVDGNTGYVIAVNSTSSSQARLFKTTNKGNNWSDRIILTNNPDKQATIDFINANTGYIARGNVIYYSTDGFTNNIQNISHRISYALDTDFEIRKLRFYNSNSIYLTIEDTYPDNWGTPDGKRAIVWKIADGGTYSNMVLMKNWPGTTNEIRLYDIDTYSNEYVTGGYREQGSTKHSLCYYTGIDLMDRANEKFDFVNFLPNSNEFRILGLQGIFKYDQINTTTPPTLIASLGNYNYNFPQHGLTFTKNTTGFAAVNDGKIYKTTDGGHNWVYDNVQICNENNNDLRNELSSVNDIVIYGGGCYASLYIRKIPINVYTNFEGVNRNGSIIIDGNTLSTNPNNPLINLRGGTMSLEALSVLNNNDLNAEAIFYKWENNSFNKTNSVYYDTEFGSIKDYYKTKLYSDNAAAISYPPQTKAIRDTTLQGSNTIVHTIHESMGGIFYSRSIDNGNSFSGEEIINKDIPDGNKNSFLTVMRELGSCKPLTYYDANKNVVVAWERYNQSNGKTELIIANRTNDVIGYRWEKYYDYQTSTSVFSSFNSNSSFNSTPKVFVSCPQSDINLHNSVIIVPHLRPNGSNTRLFVTVRYENQTENYEIDNGNISDLAVSGPYNYWGEFMLHFAYKKDGHIIYRKEYIGRDVYIGLHRDIWEVNTTFSHGDAVTHRYTPDISLRNGLPVIVYQGETPVSTAIQYEEGEAIYLNYTKYPIVEKYKEQGGNWSIFWKHQAPMFSTQQNPTTEGSKNAYAHLLNYSVNNTLFKKFVRIDGLSGYGCSPPTFTGKDAKFVRGSYQGPLGANSHPMLLTLTSQAPLFIVNKQEFTITNAIQNDVFNNLAGVIEKNDLYYKFTLGPLFANNQITFDDGSPPENVQTVIEFNDEMVTEVFMMSDYDTLILGANGCYQGDQVGPFEIIRYDVNLVNNTTHEIHRLLFHDTVNVEDSLEIEFLRGFVIENIPNGSDSFYVELVVNPDDIAGDEDYGMGGDYDGGDGGGDNPLPYKKKVFFEGDNITGNNTIPTEYSLSQNYPNPFNPTTTINYDLPKDGTVKLIVYDLLGREVSKLVNNEFKTAGRYSIVFNGNNLSSGIYFYKIEINGGKDYSMVKRMVLIK